MSESVSNIELPELVDGDVSEATPAPAEDTAHVCPRPVGVQVVCDQCNVVIDTVELGKLGNTKRQYRAHMGHRWTFLVLMQNAQGGAGGANGGQ